MDTWDPPWFSSTEGTVRSPAGRWIWRIEPRGQQRNIGEGAILRHSCARCCCWMRRLVSIWNDEGDMFDDSADLRGEAFRLELDPVISDTADFGARLDAGASSNALTKNHRERRTDDKRFSFCFGLSCLCAIWPFIICYTLPLQSSGTPRLPLIRFLIQHLNIELWSVGRSDAKFVTSVARDRAVSPTPSPYTLILLAALDTHRTRSSCCYIDLPKQMPSPLVRQAAEFDYVTKATILLLVIA